MASLMLMKPVSRFNSKSAHITVTQGPVRVVLGLNLDILKHLEADALTGKPLADLPHGIKLIDGGIGDDADARGPEVLEVHADLLGDAGPEADGRGGHLKGVLLLLGGHGRAIGPAGVPILDVREEAAGLGLVVARVGVAWAGRRVRVLDCAQQACGPHGGLVWW